MSLFRDRDILTAMELGRIQGGGSEILCRLVNIRPSARRCYCPKHLGPKSLIGGRAWHNAS
jgi:hypothetical protein